jgi:hypothetical protein
MITAALVAFASTRSVARTVAPHCAQHPSQEAARLGTKNLTPS